MWEAGKLKLSTMSKLLTDPPISLNKSIVTFTMTLEAESNL